MPYEDLLARNYTVKIILPEGASNIKVKLPTESKYQIAYDKYFSYLDLFGRPIVVITMSNSFDIHRIPFQVIFSLMIGGLSI